jgi:hypothetical protein
MNGTSRVYDYDQLYRLTSETVTGSGASDYAKTFTYDPVGNRLSQVTTGAGAANVAYTYDSRIDEVPAPLMAVGEKAWGFRRACWRAPRRARRAPSGRSGDRAGESCPWW